MTDIPHRWAIAGPTAVGKTAVGIAVAQRLGSACISADAVAVYRSLNIGSAKPTPARNSFAYTSCSSATDPSGYSATNSSMPLRLIEGLS